MKLKIATRDSIRFQSEVVKMARDSIRFQSEVVKMARDSIRFQSEVVKMARGYNSCCRLILFQNDF